MQGSSRYVTNLMNSISYFDKLNSQIGRNYEGIFFSSQTSNFGSILRQRLYILYAILYAADPLQFGPQLKESGHLFRVTGICGEAGVKIRVYYKFLY